MRAERLLAHALVNKSLSPAVAERLLANKFAEFLACKRLQAIQCRFCRASKRVRRKILRNFPLPSPACFTVMNKIVTGLEIVSDDFPILRAARVRT